MLDIKRIRNNPEGLKAALIARNKKDIDVDALLALDSERRALMAQVEASKAKRNTDGEAVPRLKKQGEDVSELLVQMKQVAQQIKDADESLREMNANINDILMTIPNIPHESVQTGADDKDKDEIYRFSEQTVFPYEPKPHWDIGTDLGILDFETAAKVTGARFTFYRGLGARLERSVISFFLDVHTQEHGYVEVLPPYLANTASMLGTGQLPKFAEDMFHIEGSDYYLIPTAEVPVTNMHRDQILSIDALPIYYCAYSACFRAEAGSAGRDTRGLIRQHQFNKVELVKFVLPETSYDELEKLTRDAQHLLELLGLPYRVVRLCSGDMGFSSAKTYDIEVWMPSYKRYVEISSCSNFEDFQARRAQIKFKRSPKDAPEFVHTLNGSGLAVGRTVAAILENYQQEDGSVVVPEVLRKYMGCDVIRK